MLNRILAVLKSGSELENYVQYEFVNYAPSLFDNFAMRKTVKSALAHSLEIDKYVTPPGVSSAVTIIDGGHLLHVVVWPTPLNYRDDIALYMQYVITHYGRGRIVVVFDGYGETLTTKSVEHSKRASLKMSAEIMLKLDINTTTSQQEFLNNPRNKTSLIKKLTNALLLKHVEVRQSRGDADMDIAMNAVTAAASVQSNESVTVVSRDTDVLVILLARLVSGDVILIQPQPGKPPKRLNIQQLRADIGANICNVLIPLHAMTGCDTTSAPMGKGKKKPLMLAKQNAEFRSCLAVFNNKESQTNEIAEAGETVMMMLYNVQHLKTLNSARFFRLKQMIARQGLTSTSKLCTLPPTSGSAKMHSYRVFLQVQAWYGNDLNPLDFGWEMRAGSLFPIGSELTAAHERLLK